jgi:hypothetical protein
MSFLGACDPAIEPAEPRFSDVARKPPLTQPTVDYITANDRPFANWVAEMARACDDHGCT